MIGYSDDDLKKARLLIGDHAGIRKEDLVTALDLMGDELGIYPQDFIPDTSHITKKAFEDLTEKNLEQPPEYTAPRGAVPEVQEIPTISISEPDLEWRGQKQEPLSRAQKISEMATWMSPEEKQKLQTEIDGYISSFDASNPPSEHRIAKDKNYYEKPKVEIGISSTYLGIPKENFGLSKADYAQLDRNNLTANGCGSGASSWVPDRTYHADYKDACNLHDILYGVPGMPKERADEIFNSGLQNALRESNNYNGPIPDEMLYTWAVRKYGDDAYENAQTRAQRSWKGGWHPLQDLDN